MLSENLGSLGTLRRLGGDDAGAIALSDEAFAIAERIGNLWGQAYGLLVVYGIYLDRGEIGRAIATMERCIAIAERAGFVPPQATTRADLATVYADLGDLERARELVGVALEVAETRQPIARPWVMAAKAEVHLLAGELDEAEAAAGDSRVELLPEPLQSTATVDVALVKGMVRAARGDHAGAVEAAETILDRLGRFGIRQFVPDALLLEGRSLAASGRTEEAADVLRRARSAAEEQGCRRVLWRVCRELGDVLASQADADGARELRSEARGLVERIASSIEDEGLRAGFLARPDVRDLVAEA